jgi:DNA polymerase-3 subunit delta
LPRLLAGTLKPVWRCRRQHLQVLEAADQLRARARELGYAEREIHDVDHRFDWNELAMSGAALSLFATRRVIELRMPTGKPGKEGSAAISAWCADPPPDTLLMITAQEWSKAHEGAWVAAVERVGVVMPVWPIRHEDMPGWISARMQSRGLKATPDAIALLAERIEGNTLAAAQEIDKLSLLVGDTVLDIDTLEASVADDARFDAFRLTDARRRRCDAHCAWSRIAAEGASDPAARLDVNQLRVLSRLANAGGNLGQRSHRAHLGCQTDWFQTCALAATRRTGALHHQPGASTASPRPREGVRIERLVAAIAMSRRGADWRGLLTDPRDALIPQPENRPLAILGGKPVHLGHPRGLGSGRISRCRGAPGASARAAAPAAARGKCIAAAADAAGFPARPGPPAYRRSRAAQAGTVVHGGYPVGTARGNRRASTAGAAAGHRRVRRLARLASLEKPV